MSLCQATCVRDRKFVISWRLKKNLEVNHMNRRFLLYLLSVEFLVRACVLLKSGPDEKR